LFKNETFFNAKLCALCGACVLACKKNAINIQNGTRVLDKEKCVGCGECASVCVNGAIEKVGKGLSAKEIVEIAVKDKEFYGNGGGITLSGGEPLINMINAIEILKLAKENGLNTAVETSGYFNGDIKTISKYVDLWLYDLKDGNEKRHLEYTGVGTERILSNLYYIDSVGGKTILRCIMVNGVNTDTTRLDKIVETYKKLKNCKGVEIFSYHDLGAGKYQSLNKNYDGSKNWIVSKSDLVKARNYLKEEGVKCKIT
jgi:pyruvate formate lyase activating enzyme